MPPKNAVKIAAPLRPLVGGLRSSMAMQTASVIKEMKHAKQPVKPTSHSRGNAKPLYQKHIPTYTKIGTNNMIRKNDYRGSSIASSGERP